VHVRGQDCLPGALRDSMAARPPLVWLITLFVRTIFGPRVPASVAVFVLTACAAPCQKGSLMMQYDGEVAVCQGVREQVRPSSLASPLRSPDR
jgi:hypothetical protein